MLDEDSHSKILEHYKIKDVETPPEFVKVELVNTGKLEEDFLSPDLKHWKLTVDQDTFPAWWAGSEEWVEKEMLKALKDTIEKRVCKAGQKIKEINEGERWYVVGGTISEVIGGTISEVWGGTINEVWGGTISDVSGGTISKVIGGTISEVWGGTISDVSGGTINDVRGGTISRVSGGTINDVRGGTINEVSGGTISKVSNYGVVMYRESGILKIRAGSEYAKVKKWVK
jgi:hypothetical protein